MTWRYTVQKESTTERLTTVFLKCAEELRARDFGFNPRLAVLTVDENTLVDMVPPHDEFGHTLRFRKGSGDLRVEFRGEKGALAAIRTLFVLLEALAGIEETDGLSDDLAWLITQHLGEFVTKPSEARYRVQEVDSGGIPVSWTLSTASESQRDPNPTYKNRLLIDVAPFGRVLTATQAWAVAMLVEDVLGKDVEIVRAQENEAPLKDTFFEQEGALAFRQGVPIEECPPGTEYFQRQWERGWLDESEAKGSPEGEVA